MLNSSNRINLKYYKTFTSNIFKKANILFFISIFSIVFWNIIFPVLIHGTEKFNIFLEYILNILDTCVEKYFTENKIVKFVILISATILGISNFEINKKNLIWFISFCCCLFHFFFELFTTLNLNIEPYDYQVILFDDIDREFVLAPEENINEPELIQNDKQNVHDSQVNNTLIKSYENIKNSTNCNITKKDTFSEIRNIINKEPDKIKQQQLNFILDYIEKTKTPISSINANVSDVLHLIWNRINSDELAEHRETLYENLIYELRDSTNVKVTNKCLTGIWARLMDTANKIDPLIDIKPKWALRRELLNKANKHLEKLTESLNKEENDILNKIELNQDEYTWFNKFKKKYIKSFTKKCEKEYVDTGIFKLKELKKELNSWIDSIL